jgi:hypothetical protein
MATKEFAHLVKPMIIKAPPKGLYAEPRIWMEAKDLEGFNAHFSYGFVKKPSTFHPLKGMLVHPYDEILVFEGTKNTDIFYLGAEVSVLLGEEQEEHIFTEPSCVLIPKGTPHGPVTVKKLDRPIVHYTIGLDAAYKAESVSPKSSSATRGDKYRKYIKKMTTNFKSMGSQGSGWTGEQQYGSIKAADMGVGPGNGDEVVWLYGEDLEGFNVNFTWGFYSRCGKWHRGGEAHYHPEAEILVFVGLDPDKLDFLGAELELGMGKDYERHIFNTPTVAICPAAFPHLPLITRWADKPYGFIVICLSGEHASPWVEAK